MPSPALTNVLRVCVHRVEDMSVEVRETRSPIGYGTALWTAVGGESSGARHWVRFWVCWLVQSV